MKTVILVRTDLDMPVGKVAAQACHGMRMLMQRNKDRYPSNIQYWADDKYRTICLAVESEKEMFELKHLAEHKRMDTYLVTDAGLTCNDPGTHTCLVIGPHIDPIVDEVTGRLRLLK